ncbi:MAG: CidA/LrgA family protein [Clostridiales bacterium]|nr:CidA/LrgA family protein [Clostridiales bacterium]
MKTLGQIVIILLVSFAGELLNYCLPLPIPASIYGIVILFCLLEFKVIPLRAVKETGDFLVSIMQLMFIPAAVGLLEAWDVIAPNWLPYILITLISTFVVMFFSGRVTQAVIRLGRVKEERHE